MFAKRTITLQLLITSKDQHKRLELFSPIFNSSVNKVPVQIWAGLGMFGTGTGEDSKDGLIPL